MSKIETEEVIQVFIESIEQSGQHFGRQMEKKDAERNQVVKQKNEQIVERNLKITALENKLNKQKKHIAKCVDGMERYAQTVDIDEEVKEQIYKFINEIDSGIEYQKIKKENNDE